MLTFVMPPIADDNIVIKINKNEYKLRFPLENINNKINTIIVYNTLQINPETTPLNCRYNEPIYPHIKPPIIMLNIR